jgi:hypothetical protein
MRKRFGPGGIVGAVLFVAGLVRPILAACGQARLVDQFVTPRIAPFVTNTNLLYVGLVGLVLILIEQRRRPRGPTGDGDPSMEHSGSSLTVFEQRQLREQRMERAGPVIAIIEDQMREIELCLLRLNDPSPGNQSWLPVLLSQKIYLPAYDDAVAQSPRVSPEAYQDLRGAGERLRIFDRAIENVCEASNTDNPKYSQDVYISRIRDASVFLVEAKQFLTRARSHLSEV